MLILALIAGTPIENGPEILLRNFQPAPGANYTIISDANGIAEWSLSSSGSVAANLTPIAYVPAATGNASNNNEIVTDPNGDVWVIDSDGDALKLSTEIDGSETSVTAGSNVSISGSGTTGNPYVISSGGGGAGTFTYDAGGGATVTASAAGVTFAKNTATGVYIFTIPTDVVLTHATVDGDVADDDGNGELFVQFNYSGTRFFNQSLATAWRPHVYVWESGGSAPSRSTPKNILPVNVQGISSVGSGDLELTLQNISTITPNPVFQFVF